MIAQGHRLPDILDYTLAQVRGFALAGARREVAHDARQLSLLALAMRGEARQLERTLVELQEEVNRRAHHATPR